MFRNPLQTRWATGWRATRGRRREHWREGWDRADRCPPDPVVKRGRRRDLPEQIHEEPLFRGPSWVWWRRRRIALIRRLRRVGYLIRGEWGIAEVTDNKGRAVRVWADGPCTGLPVVDPWIVARQLLDCSRFWPVGLFEAGGLVAVRAYPTRCRRGSHCPVCAGLSSRSRAGEILGAHDLGLIGRRGLALATLTQRAHPDECLFNALERLDEAWRRLTRDRVRGSVARAWGSHVSGWHVGHEVTRGSRGEWWHAHLHVLVDLTHPHHDVARSEIGEAWRQATGATAIELGLRGYGWDPVSGRKLDEETGRVYSWWQPIEDKEGTSSIYQAAKYATPITALDGYALAEWLTVAAGRHWRQTGGTWRKARASLEPPPLVLGAERWAAMCEESTAALEAAIGVSAPQLGRLISRGGPGAAPLLRRVTRMAGDPDAAGELRWQLRPDVGDPELPPRLPSGWLDQGARWERQLGMDGRFHGWELILTPSLVGASLDRWRTAHTAWDRLRAEHHREADRSG